MPMKNSFFADTELSSPEKAAKYLGKEGESCWPNLQKIDPWNYAPKLSTLPKAFDATIYASMFCLSVM